VIKSGGFDRFGFSRKALLEQIELLVESAKKASDAKKNAVGSLFGDDAEITTVKLELKNANEYGLKEILEFEKSSRSRPTRFANASSEFTFVEANSKS